MRAVLLSVVLALVGVALSVAQVAADSPEATRQAIAALEQERQTLEGEISVNLESAANMEMLGKQAEQEARECLQDDPPRYSSAAALQATARECYAEARKARAEADRAKRRIQEIDREIARLQQQALGR